MFGSGGMGGNSGGMPNIPPALMQDPEFMQIMQDPATQELMPVLMQAQQNPSILQQYQNHPTMQRLARVLQRHGMGGGMGGGMGNSGWGAPASSASSSQPTNYVNISSSIQLDPFLNVPNTSTVMYFTMQGCGPCARIAPFWDRLASSYKGKINFLKIQQSSRDLCAKYGVQSFPTFIFMFNRQEVDRIKGAAQDMLEAKVKIWVHKAAVANAPKERFIHFPVAAQNLPVFRKANLKRAQKKILETNTALREASDAACCDDAELSTLLRFVAKLNTDQAMNKQFDQREYALMEKLLNWSEPGCFPALEVFAIMILDTEPSRYYAQNQDLLTKVVSFCGSENVAAKFLACRAVINMFSSRDLLNAFAENLSDILDAITPCRSVAGHKLAQKVRKCYTNILTIFANYFRNAKDFDSSDLKVQMLSTLNEMLLEEQNPDVLYSALVCTGTLLMGDAEAVGFTEMFDLASVLSSIKNRCQGGDKVNTAIRVASDELQKLLEEGE